MGGDFVACEFADLASHLFVHFVEWVLVAALAACDVETHFAIERLTGGPPQQLSSGGGEALFEGFVAQAEVVDNSGESFA